MQKQNVYGNKLNPCNCAKNGKTTGYLRDNYCKNIESDVGTHIICAIMTDEFLKFTYSKGNDLISPRNNFPGLVKGDCWCICILRWIEAYNAGVAPPIILESSDIRSLYYVPLSILENYSISKFL